MWETVYLLNPFERDSELMLLVGGVALVFDLVWVFAVKIIKTEWKPPITGGELLVGNLILGLFLAMILLTANSNLESREMAQNGEVDRIVEGPAEVQQYSTSYHITIDNEDYYFDISLSKDIIPKDGDKYRLFIMDEDTGGNIESKIVRVDVYYEEKDASS